MTSFKIIKFHSNIQSKVFKNFDKLIVIISYQYNRRIEIYYMCIFEKICLDELQEKISVRQKNYLMNEYQTFCIANTVEVLVACIDLICFLSFDLVVIAIVTSQFSMYVEFVELKYRFFLSLKHHFLSINLL